LPDIYLLLKDACKLIRCAPADVGALASRQKIKVWFPHGGFPKFSREDCEYVAMFLSHGVSKDNEVAGPLGNFGRKAGKERSCVS